MKPKRAFLVAVTCLIMAALGARSAPKKPKIPSQIQKFVISERTKYIKALEKALTAAVKRNDPFGTYTAAYAMLRVNPIHRFAGQYLKKAREDIRFLAITKGRPITKDDIKPYKANPYTFVDGTIYLNKSTVLLGQSSYGQVLVGTVRSKDGVQFGYGGGAFRFHWGSVQANNNPALRSGEWTEWGVAYFGKEIAFMWVGKNFYGEPDGHARGPSVWVAARGEVQVRGITILE